MLVLARCLGGYSAAPWESTGRRRASRALQQHHRCNRCVPELGGTNAVECGGGGGLGGEREHVCNVSNFVEHHTHLEEDAPALHTQSTPRCPTRPPHPHAPASCGAHIHPERELCAMSSLIRCEKCSPGAGLHGTPPLLPPAACMMWCFVREMGEKLGRRLLSGWVKGENVGQNI